VPLFHSVERPRSMGHKKTIGQPQGHLGSGGL
jgi:hypothetical protein